MLRGLGVLLGGAALLLAWSARFRLHRLRNGDWLLATVLASALIWVSVDPNSLNGVLAFFSFRAGGGGRLIGIALFGALASPLLLRPGRPLLRSLALGALLTATGVASLHAAQAAVLERHEGWYVNQPSVIRFLRSQPPWTIYAQNKIAAARLNIASGFTLGFDFFAPTSRVGRLRLAPPDSNGLQGPALVVIDDEILAWSGPAGFGEPPAYLRTPPPEWAPVFTAGTVQGHRTRVYRFSPADARREFERAQQAASASPSADNLARVVGAAAAARDFCAAASSWLRLLAVSRSAAEPFEPTGLLRGCLAQDPGAVGPNMFQNHDFAAGADAWGRSPDANADRTVEVDKSVASPVMHVSFRGGNWAVMVQQATLEPDTAYVYSMRVRSTAPLVVLYWQADVGHPFEENRVYETWTTLASVFVTPRWNGRRTPTSFSPILMMAPGDAWIADVRLARFTFGQSPR